MCEMWLTNKTYVYVYKIVDHDIIATTGWNAKICQKIISVVYCFSAIQTITKLPNLCINAARVNMVAVNICDNQ